MTDKKSYASFFERLLARLIDGAIYSMLLLTPLSPIAASNSYFMILDGISNYVIYILFVTLIILPINILMVSYLKGTAGMLLMGIRIEKENGYKLSLWEAFVRNTIGQAVSSLFFSLGYFWIFKNEKRQAWHDMIVGSVVTRKLGSGWILGILIFIIFIIINICIIVQSGIGVSENFSLYQNLFYLK